MEAGRVEEAEEAGGKTIEVAEVLEAVVGDVPAWVEGTRWIDLARASDSIVYVRLLWVSCLNVVYESCVETSVYYHSVF